MSDAPLFTASSAYAPSRLVLQKMQAWSWRSGSHGGVTVDPMTSAFKPRLAFFNDAGFGVDRAGTACLPILDSEGIAASTVAAGSACIGDGESTLTQGIISAVNETAYLLGAKVGEPPFAIARTVAGKV